MQKLATTRLSSGELVINFDGECEGKDFDLHLSNPRADTILEIAFISNLIKCKGGNLRTLFCKYFPYARFEREAINIAQFIANLGFKDIVVTEPRNQLALSIWLSKAIFLPMVSFYQQKAKDKIIFSPDDESSNRAVEMALMVNTKAFSVSHISEDMEGKEAFLIYDILDDTTHKLISDALISLKVAKCSKIILAVAHYIPYQKVEGIKDICDEVLYLNAANQIVNLKEEG